MRGQKRTGKSRYVACVGVFAALTVVACDDSTVPHYSASGPGVGSGGGSGLTPDPTGGGGQAGDGGSAGTPGPWSFKADDVYVWGFVTEANYPALGFWETPNIAATAFSRFNRRGGMLSPEGDLLYSQQHASGPDTLRRFVCDDCAWTADMDYESYPNNGADEDAIKNDPVISTPCFNLYRIVVGITGEILKNCGRLDGAFQWYDGSDQLLEFLQGHNGPVMSLGYDNKLLTSIEIFDISDGSSVPLTGDFPTISRGFTARVAGPDSFWMAIEDERWTIDANSGVGTLDGEFPPLPDGLSQITTNGALVRHGKLDGEGNLFQLVRDADFKNFLVRRTLGGTSEVLLEDGSGVLIYLREYDWLVTGP
ncbi:MAG: hypothetical protein ACN4G0_11610 [Polyangiales bacterium]